MRLMKQAGLGHILYKDNVELDLAEVWKVKYLFKQKKGGKSQHACSATKAEVSEERDWAAGGWTKRSRDRLGSSVTQCWPWYNICNLGLDVRLDE